MGTLSGGGTEVISVGRRCLLGANAGLGISLGDDCVVEAGLYVTAGTKVQTADGQTVKARELGCQQSALPAQFGDRSRRGGQTGRHRHHAERGPARQLGSARRVRFQRRAAALVIGCQFEMPDLIGIDLAQAELPAVGDQPLVGLHGAMSTALPSTCLDVSGDATNCRAASTLP